MKETKNISVTVNPDSTTQQIALSNPTIDYKNKAMEGYFSTLKLEHIKSDYNEITKELVRLNTLDKLLESTSRKRAFVPTLEATKKNMEKEYQSLYPIVEDWLKTSFSHKGKKKEKKLKILLMYYSNIKETNLQDVINQKYPPYIVERSTEEAEKVLRYRANNLRQEIHTAWKQQIEGK